MAKRITTTGIEFLEGGGECGALIRSKDWSQTLLGTPEQWPQSLKTAVRIILTSRQPMFVWWGKDLINLYNDPYRAIVGGKHPEALGQPAREVWREVWDQIGPRARAAISRNVGTYDESLLLIMRRHGYEEETYYTFSYSPIPGPSDEPAGIICANTDDTQRIIGERQMALLKELAARNGTARSAKDACRLSAKALQTNPYDIPFAMIYLYDRKTNSLELAGLAGIAKAHPSVRQSIPLDGPPGQPNQPDPWLLDKVIKQNKPQYIDNVHLAFDNLPTGAWGKPPFGAVMVPIGRADSNSQSGALVVGLNPYRLYDGNYKDFIKLMVGEISAGITNAEVYAEERKRAESLAELDRAKTDFFNNVSHEFRTPLTLMLGPLEDLLHNPQGPESSDKPVLPQDIKNQLEVMHRNGLRLQKLVNTLLDFSRIEASRVQAVFTPTDLSTLTADLASNFRSAVEKAGMKLVISAPKMSQMAYVDKEMWEKIVLNLVSNAFKYTLRGTITVRVRELAESFELSVKDTGIGIRKKDMSRLFERFHRIQGVEARTHEGTGIGLSLVNELVKQHKGSVSVASTYGKGTSFTISIPKGFSHLSSAQVAHDKKARATVVNEQFIQEASRWHLDDLLDTVLDVAKRKPGAASGDNSHLPHIVLADDNADMREYITRLLRQFYRVTTAADGQAALELIRKDPPDVVVTDIMMRRLDGFGLLKALREDPATNMMPVILLSARAGEEARIEGLAAGANDYLVKPFGSRELLARINAHLEMARLRQETSRGILAERQRLFDLLMQAPAAIAIMHGPDHVFNLVNSRYMELIGADRQVLGKPIREALPDIAGQGFYELLDNVYETGETYTGNEALVRLDPHGDGSTKDLYVNFVYQPTKDEQGKIYGILIHAVEVTAQVQARRKLMESEQRLRFMAESMPQMIFTALPDGTFNYFSPQWQRYTGLTTSFLRATKRAHYKPVHPDDVAGTERAWRRALKNGKPLEHEYRLRRKDGSYRWHICRVSPQKDAKGDIMLWIGSATDIDDMKRATERRHELEVKTATLTEQRTQLMALNQAKDEFISLASHQLRTPATGVKQYIGMLLQGYAGEVTSDQRVFLQTAYESNERQITIVNDLLQVARIDAGKVTLHKKTADMVRITKSVLNEHASQFASRDQTLTTDFKQPQLNVPVDEDRIRMVIDNIIDNASKYTEAHKVIRISLKATSRNMLLTVKDQGIGMDAKDIDKVFQKFSRLDNPLSNATEGSGLGLYWAKKIVDLHGGSITVRSHLGKGTAVVIALPLQ
jgi:PAS domain S-box-containing protein